MSGFEEFKRSAETVSGKLAEISQQTIKNAALLNRNGRRRSKFAHAGTRMKSGKLEPCVKLKKRCIFRFYGDTVERVFCLAEQPCWRQPK
jgi:hypothetical protein